jgi:hypothetical protein
MNAYLLSQTMEYLGFVIHSKSHSLYLRLENVAEIITLCSTALDSLNSAVILDVKSRQDLSWWIANVKECNGRPISATDPDLTIFSDVSLLGWGGGGGAY